MANQLKDEALLVKFTRHNVSTRVRDVNASRTIDEMNETKDAGTYYKTLFKKSTEIQEIFALCNEAYTYHRKYTLPWLDDGIRILGADYYDTYSEAMSKFRRDLADKINELESNYSKICLEDLQKLGKLGVATDYPSFLQFKNSVTMEVRFFPVPDSGDFRVKVSAEAKAELDELIKEATITGKKEIYQRVEGALRKIIEICGKKEPRIHKSTFDNLFDLADVMKHLNVHKDNDINKLSKELYDLASSVSVDELRRERIERERIGKYADDLLKTVLKMGGKEEDTITYLPPSIDSDDEEEDVTISV